MSPGGFACDCCGGGRAEVVYRNVQSIYSVEPWSVRQCTQCGNMATAPAPAPELLRTIYADRYLYPIHFAIIGEKAMRARCLARRIRRLVPAGFGKTVLEVGCMFGYLLEALRRDYAVQGIEIGEAAVRYCRDRGLPVVDTSLENFLAASTDRFDVIVLQHVLEHLHDPGGVLGALRARLNPGGKIVVSVPNSRSISRRVFGRYWGWWQVPVHLNHFNLSALTALARRSGMRVLSHWARGGDSLMLLLNVMNLLGYRGGDGGRLGVAGHAVIRSWSWLSRCWYWLGNEELTVVLEA